MGTIVSEDVCSRGGTPCYLVRTLGGHYIPCQQNDVLFFFELEAVRDAVTVEDNAERRKQRPGRKRND